MTGPSADPATPPGPLLLVTGATGHVGGLLLARLQREGRRVRCMARRPAALAARVAGGTEVVQGDVTRPETLAPALAGVDTAYYLVHSMASAGGYAEADRAAAEAFGAAARRAGARRIVYLGGLGHGPGLSGHLASRQEVGRALAAAGVPVVELRAGIVIGSGSTSFEMIRALVDRLPVMVTPRWVATRTQPIAAEDVLEYLVRAAELDAPGGLVVEVGGPDVVAYRDLMREYARQRGLRRLMIPVPVLSPRLSSLWLGLVTPVHARVGRELVEGLRNETVVRGRAAPDLIPGVRPRGVREAIARTLADEDRALAATRWSETLSAGARRRPPPGASAGRHLVDSRTVRVAAPPGAVLARIESIGGRGGWRVEAVEPGRLLRLRARMRLPGRAWLQFEAEPDGEAALIRQTAVFDPAGVGGRASWHALRPLRALVLRRMIRRIAAAA